MLLTILGSGTSSGVPLIGCDCAVCRSRDPKNKRLRASAWLQSEGKSILIDSSVDFRQQALRAKIGHLDAVVYTHPHADHVYGIDDLRAFNFLQKRAIPIYGNQWTISALKKNFSYIFHRETPYEGGAIAKLDPQEFSTQSPEIDVCGVSMIPISLPHGKQETVGYRIKSLAYVTDCHFVPAAARDRLRELDVLVLDCVRLRPHGTHLNLEGALEVVSELRPKKTFLTHLGHDFEHSKWNKKLPKGVALAYDGQKIRARD
jgi:phosphoribosyl 1,2-cyclic phosphate phosphodiesterase